MRSGLGFQQNVKNERKRACLYRENGTEDEGALRSK